MNIEADYAARAAVRELLIALGENPNREGLQDTPRRMSAMLYELCHKERFDFTVFDSEGMNEMIVQSHIPFYSLCEHHCLPFMGEAHVAYIPNGKIVGLSKLARAVGYCAKGLQNQERITTAVANMLEENLHPAGIGVVLRARHMCVEMRGVKAHDTYTTTSCLRGVLQSDASTRAEFLGLTK
jgi:GTP cyclohydrolase IA